ncbi:MULTISPECIES: hypothetical protein [Bradyrhizobium]|uniref:hypothetical protein n=1 Tax=Bradyrhizobium TaxID=374 RepID=UPI00195AFC8E|nr:hypothetical protein [Bradyrhizobium canariense]MBM7486058.1 hypothetical protein [Bradyrhizobium canariense]
MIASNVVCADTNHAPAMVDTWRSSSCDPPMNRDWDQPVLRKKMRSDSILICLGSGWRKLSLRAALVERWPIRRRANSVVSPLRCVGGASHEE